MKAFFYCQFYLCLFFLNLVGNAEIETCINNLDQKKLREIIAQGLVMRTEDKNKHLDQTNAIIDQAQLFNKQKSTSIPYAYSKIQWDRRKDCLFYCALASYTAFLYLYVGLLSEQMSAENRQIFLTLGSPIPAYFCFAAYKACTNLRSSRIINNVLKKAITVQALLKNIPVTAS